MVFRTCWVLSFVWEDFSFEDGGEGLNRTCSNAYFMLYIVFALITLASRSLKR